MIENIYPLSPMQQGMLFHSLEHESAALYVDQVGAELAGPLDLAAMRDAWQRLLQRHAVLRTSFVWEDVDTPLQIVERDPELPWHELDWSSLDPAEQQSQLRRALAADLDEGFELGTAPLVRLRWFKLAPERHFLLWTRHHLLMDGWSVPIVVGDLLAFYRAAASGRRCELAAARPYADYIEWLQRQDEDAAVRYWRSRLAGFDTPSSPAFIKRTPRAPHTPFRREVCIVDRETLGGLLALASRHHLTLNTLVQAAWAVVLSCHSGVRDVVFGSTTSVRPADLEYSDQMVGLFINTLPVRVEVSPWTPFFDWLKQVQRHDVESRQYDYTPLTMIQKASELEAGVRLFDSIVAFENYPSLEVTGEATALRMSIDREHATIRTNYLLAIAATPGPEELLLEFTGDVERLEPAVVSRCARQMHQVLHSMAFDPCELVADVQILSAEERRQVVTVWNATEDELPAGTVTAWVKARGSVSPDAIAVHDAAGVVTYAALCREMTRIAAGLRRRCISPEARVGVCMERSARWVAALLGVLDSGCVYVALDPVYPLTRLSEMIVDAQPAAVLIDPGGVVIPGAEPITATLDELSDDTLEADICASAPMQLAYIFYTSGSTGRPKAAMVTHEGMANHVWAKVRTLALGADDIVAQTAAASFDISVWQAVAALTAGGQVWVAPRAAVSDSAALLDILAQQRATVLETVPTLLAEMVAERRYRPARPADLAALRWLISNAEALPTELCREWMRSCPHAGFINTYGATECSDDTCHFVAGPDDAGDALLVPLGKSLCNVRHYVLDDVMRPVPVGVIGELYVGGLGVGRGYWQQPGLTAARFVPDPWHASARLYRTGDLGCYRDDGTLEFYARQDTQVKIAGHRVEVEEVAHAVRDVLDARDAVVSTFADVTGTHLVAYVVLPPGRALDDPSHVRRRLLGRLPHHMVPSAFVAIDQVPLTPNGKVDRSRLPPVAGSEAASEELDRSAQDVETLLADIWTSALRIAHVGPTDNFFELGGDSIVSLQIVARSRAAGLPITVRDVFQAQTVRALAVLARSLPAARVDRTTRRADGPIPLTPIQRWFFAQEFAHPFHWNQSLLLAVPGGVTPNIVEAALTHVARQHDALRLRFRLIDGEWQQEYGDGAAGPTLEQVSWPDLVDAEWAAALGAHASAVQAGLDLERGPVLRACWYDAPDGRHRLLLVGHHLVVDAVSWRILLEDLQLACAQLMRGEPIAVPAAACSFGVWADALGEASAAVESERAYWSDVTARPGLVALPSDGPAEICLLRDADVVSAVLSAEETEALLHETQAAYRLQPEEVFVAALSHVLTRWARGDVLIHLEHHGRGDLAGAMDVSRTVGWFTAIYPFRLTSPLDTAAAAHLPIVKEALRAVPRHGVGYGLLRFRSETPLVDDAPADTLFNYLGNLDGVLRDHSGWRLAPEGAGLSRSAANRCTHAFEISVSIRGGRVDVEWCFGHRRHHRATVERLLGEYLESLRAFVAHCRGGAVVERSPSDFPLAGLEPDELDSILNTIN